MIRELLSEEDSFGWSRATSYYTRLSVFIWRGMMVRMMVQWVHGYVARFIRMIQIHFLYFAFCFHLSYVDGPDTWTIQSHFFAFLFSSDDTWAHILCWWYVSFCQRKEGRIHWDYPHPLPSIVFLRQIQVDGFVKHLMLRCAFVFQLFKCTSRNSEEWVKRFIMEVWNHFLKISSHLFRTLLFNNFYDTATSFEGYSL